ncbi:MAG: hypothetical protein GY859_40570, partial [Desulfobacterales bacterium]|nr:hypothetical protein [Desulfobacterales bacterium]
HALGLGLPKTGTTSLAGIFGGYRSAHEFQQWETHQAVIAYKNGRASRSRFRDFILARDAAGRLEMDAAHFNRHYLEIVADEFPKAVFICLIRDPFSWVNSLVNYWTLPGHEAIQSEELDNGTPFDLPPGACEAKAELARNFSRYIDAPLSFWAGEYGIMLAALPPERSLVVRTHEIADNFHQMARLVNIPADAPRRKRSHLNKMAYHVKILDRCDPRFLRDKFDQHCGELLETHFPGYTLDDFFDNRPIPPHPVLSPTPG